MHFSALNAQYPTGRQLHGYLSFTSSKTNAGRYEYIQFSAILPATAISCFWDFGDGTTSNQTAPLKNYTTQGVYTIKLIAIDANGNTNSVSRQNFIAVNNSITAFPLDSNYVGMSGAPKGVYSFRQYLSGATFCVNLRRSSDNAQQNFGFTNQGYLDTDAVNTWAAGSNLYITKWYDQSGWADANQTSQTLQPQLVIPAGGYAYMLSSNSYLSINIPLIFGPNITFTMNVVCGSVSSTNSSIFPLYQFGSSGGAWNYLAISCVGGNQSLTANYSAGSGNTQVTSVLKEAFTSLSSITLSHNSSKIYVYHSGALQTPATGLAANNDLSNSSVSVSQIGNASTVQHYIWEAIFLSGSFDYSYIYNSQKSFYTTLN